MSRPTHSTRSSNHLGDRGEVIFHNILTRYHGSRPLFRVHFLGDKWPLVDFICELEGTWKNQRPFFLVQVKATHRGFIADKSRLKVKIDHDHAWGIRGYKVPVYLVGIDARAERAFIVGAAGTRISSLSSLSCGTEVNQASRLVLWKEVRDWWPRVPRQRNWTHFREPRWFK